jgi:hypothetical protein
MNHKEKRRGLAHIAVGVVVDAVDAGVASQHHPAGVDVGGGSTSKHHITTNTSAVPHQTAAHRRNIFTAPAPRTESWHKATNRKAPGLHPTGRPAGAERVVEEGRRSHADSRRCQNRPAAVEPKTAGARVSRGQGRAWAPVGVEAEGSGGG